MLGKIRKWLESLYNAFRSKPASGYKKDLPDSRDYEYRIGGETPKSIPSIYNWKKLPAQGITQSCVGFAIARAIEVLIYQIVKEETGDDYYYEVSELFTWYNARKVRGWETINSGVYPRDALKELFSKGYLPASSMPFKNSWTYKPTAAQFRTAKMARDMLLSMKMEYNRVSLNDSLKLPSKGIGVLVSLPINSSWNTRYSKDIPHTGNYHYMFLEGVEEHNGTTYCKLANSWNKGYLYVPKAYYLEWAQDLWVITAKK